MIKKNPLLYKEIDCSEVWDAPFEDPIIKQPFKPI